MRATVGFGPRRTTVTVEGQIPEPTARNNHNHNEETGGVHEEHTQRQEQTNDGYEITMMTEEDQSITPAPVLFREQEQLQRAEIETNFAQALNQIDVAIGFGNSTHDQPHITIEKIVTQTRNFEEVNHQQGLVLGAHLDDFERIHHIPTEQVYSPLTLHNETTTLI